VEKSRKRRNTELNLKKQSQFPNGQNERNVNNNKEIREIYRIGHLVKTKPNKANIDCDKCFLPMAQEIATALRASQ